MDSNNYDHVYLNVSQVLILTKSSLDTVAYILTIYSLDAVLITLHPNFPIWQITYPLLSPTTSLTFLGIQHNTTSMEASFTSKRKQALLQELSPLHARKMYKMRIAILNQ